MSDQKDDNIITMSAHRFEMKINPQKESMEMVVPERYTVSPIRPNTFLIHAVGQNTPQLETTENVVQFIEGTNIGTKMSDGTIYAGTRPQDENVPLFVPPFIDSIQQKTFKQILDHLDTLKAGDTDGCPFNTCGYNDWLLGTAEDYRQVFMAVILGQTHHITLKANRTYPCTAVEHPEQGKYATIKNVSGLSDKEGKPHIFRERSTTVALERSLFWFPVRYGLPKGSIAHHP